MRQSAGFPVMVETCLGDARTAPNASGEHLRLEDGRLILESHRRPHLPLRSGGSSPPREHVATRRSVRRTKPPSKVDWLCTAAAFAVVLGVVFGAGADRPLPTIGGEQQRTDSLPAMRGSP